MLWSVLNREFVIIKNKKEPRAARGGKKRTQISNSFCELCDLTLQCFKNVHKFQFLYNSISGAVMINYFSKMLANFSHCFVGFSFLEYLRGNPENKWASELRTMTEMGVRYFCNKHNI